MAISFALIFITFSSVLVCVTSNNTCEYCRSTIQETKQFGLMSNTSDSEHLLQHSFEICSCFCKHNSDESKADCQTPLDCMFDGIIKLQSFAQLELKLGYLVDDFCDGKIYEERDKLLNFVLVAQRIVFLTKLGNTTNSNSPKRGILFSGSKMKCNQKSELIKSEPDAMNTSDQLISLMQLVFGQFWG